MAIWYSHWAASGANQGFREAGKPEMQYQIVPFQLDSQATSGQKRTLQTKLTNFSEIHCITKNAKKPERIFEVVEFACFEEGRRLLLGGVEGTTYNIEDGKRAATEEYLQNWSNNEWKKKAGLAYEFRFLPYAQGTGSDGVPYNLSTPEVQLSLQTERSQEVIQKMGLEKWYEKVQYIVIDPAATSVTLDTTSEESRIETKLIDFRIKAYAKLIMAKTEAEFDSLWEQLKADYLKLQPEKVIDYYNTVYKNAKSK